MIVSVDFDGTITKSSDPGDRGFNQLRPEAERAIRELTTRGVSFVLLTGRRDEYVQEAIDLIREWGLPIDCSTPTRKRITDFYLDDRNFGWSLDWHSFYREVVRIMKNL